MRMPVSAMPFPALVAIGQAQHFLAPSVIWPWQQVRRLAVNRTTAVLAKMQPDSGGFGGYAADRICVDELSCEFGKAAKAGINGLEAGDQSLFKLSKSSVREDGSWPIDTNLATWVTSLAIHAIEPCDALENAKISDELIQWHLNCQHRKRHPFTGASPGGWVGPI